MVKQRLLLFVMALLLVLSSPGLVGAASTDSVVSSEVIKYDEMIETLQILEEQSNGELDVFTLAEIGIEETSEEGRDLYVGKIGNGDKVVWVQGRIHGGEPYGTNATLRVIENLIQGEDSNTQAMLDELTMYFIPMYNPDGAERNQRGTLLIDPETGQPKLDERGRTISVDLNRDWVEGGFAASESLAFYKLWAQVKPEMMLDIHHQGNKNFYGTSIPVTMSLGIPLAPGGPTIPNLKGGEIDKLARQSMVHVYDSFKPYKQFTIDQYITGNTIIDIHGGVSSAMMLGMNHLDLNPDGHSNPAVFLETSGQFLYGEREPMIQQNIIATEGFLSGIASGEMYNADPDRWHEIPIRPIIGYNTDYAGTVLMDTPQAEVPFVVSASDIKGLVDFYVEEDKFVNPLAAYPLQLHLNAVSHYEENGLTDKAAKHMKGLHPLLDHQNKNQLISSDAHKVLKAYVDYVNK